jgi:twinkle protein
MEGRSIIKTMRSGGLGEQAAIRGVPDRFNRLEDRGIAKESAKRFKIGVNHDVDVDVSHVYPYFKDGKHVANKCRKRSAKEFFWEGDTKDVELFGQQEFPTGSAKTVTVVEGECDAAAAYELMGSRWPVVSVTSSGSAVRDCRNNYEYLDGFENIVLCFDADEAKVDGKGEKHYPGQEAAKKVAALFKPGKVRVVTLRRHKDPNDYLKAGLFKEFTKEWWDGPTYTPDGLKIGRDMWDEIVNQSTPYSVDYPFERVNRMTYGIRLSEAVVVTADTGVGKTSFFKEIEYSLLQNPELKEKGYGVGFLHLEETNTDTALGLMSVHASKPFHLPDTPRTTEELKDAFDSTVNTDRVVVWDHFGSNSVDAVLDKIRHMSALGCKYIFLDHLSIVVSDQSGDERKQLDEISTKLKTMAMEQELAIICVVHTNRQGQIRGTAGVEQLANIVMKLERDKTAIDPWRRNVTKITVHKNRFCGRAGPCEWLWFNEMTNRLIPLTQEEVDVYESGESLRDDQQAW